MNRILFTNDTNYRFRYKKDYQNILDLAKEEFNSEKDIDVDILIVNNEQIQLYNQEYRNKNYPTDILSFPFDDDMSLNFLDNRPLGQIIISYEKIKEHAKEYNHSIRREFCYIFCHGIAHLFGFDHLTPEEEANMNKHVDAIMEKLSISR
ncbi:rRNA maturation RNase YbeY [Mycoplasma zalophi]|uniref:Endoribonuclease YbeY n=1 Tax=Mycoplasma zalophi TaxID=191287 RepID=A0ABS6DNW0_9MOLU|nr:rRNA maturation RNase YbeY [Mycoplasma zalophi]MBU4691214.1 rRNA maturation RNase YbeY [Mycoplasma zalophi]MBU4692011.1 rRNA maturation RNase YbeY [Mycoplasma zalophi]MCU4117432.1 rRNA maturation RNase YbeY [Mycoplasma zalophi]